MKKRSGSKVKSNLKHEISEVYEDFLKCLSLLREVDSSESLSFRIFLLVATLYFFVNNTAILLVRGILILTLLVLGSPLILMYFLYLVVTVGPITLVKRIKRRARRFSKSSYREPEVSQNADPPTQVGFLYSARLFSGYNPDSEGIFTSNRVRDSDGSKLLLMEYNFG